MGTKYLAVALPDNEDPNSVADHVRKVAHWLGRSFNSGVGHSLSWEMHLDGQTALDTLMREQSTMINKTSAKQLAHSAGGSTNG